jgi:hypothetical protein
MATLTVSFAATITVNLDIPDSKLKKVLNGDIDLSECFSVEFKSNVKGIEESTATPDLECDELEFSDIVKDNGNDYEWDGESLIKL